jgi:hypothetical protein
MAPAPSYAPAASDLAEGSVWEASANAEAADASAEKSTFSFRSNKSRLVPVSRSSAKVHWAMSAQKIRAVTRGKGEMGDGLRFMRQHSNNRISSGIKAVSTASSILPLLSMLCFGYATDAVLSLPTKSLIEPPAARCLQLVFLALAMLLSAFSITFAVLEFYYIELSCGMHHTSISRFVNIATSGSSSLPDGKKTRSHDALADERLQKRRLFELENELDRAINAACLSATGKLTEEVETDAAAAAAAAPSVAPGLGVKAEEAHRRLEQTQFKIKLLRERLHEKDEQTFLKMEHDHLGRLDDVIDRFISIRRWARDAMWLGLVSLMMAVAAKLFDAESLDGEPPTPAHPIVFVCVAILIVGALAVMLMVGWFRKSYRPLAKQVQAIR